MVLVIADDLTGANDTGVQFQKKGFSTLVKVLMEEDNNTKEYDNYDVVCINTDSRWLTGTDAYNKVYRLMKKNYFNNKGNIIYKKIDSVFRGNPGYELDAVMDASGISLAFVAPSYPDNNRRIKDGILTLPDGNEIGIASEIKAQSKRKVINISLEQIRGDKNELTGTILKYIENGCEILVFDGEENEDLELIYKISKKIPVPKIFCGSAGLAEAFSSNRPEAGPRIFNSEEGINLLVVGSRSKETALQVKVVTSFYSAPVVVIDIDEVQRNDRKIIENSLREIMEQVKQKNQFIIIAVNSLFKNTAVPLKQSPEDNGQAMKIVEILGEIVKGALKFVKINTIIAIGGDTSLQVCKALKVKGIELQDEIIKGIPIGRMIGGATGNMNIVTKSGGFGRPDALISVMQYLQQNQEV